MNGLDRNEAIRAATDELEVDRQYAATLVDLAIDKIAVAADYERRTEIGQSYHRLNHLYTVSLRQDDPRAALAAQKELNRLLDLYPNDSEPDSNLASEAVDNAKTLDVIREHLLPLNLAPDDYPIEEHARIAAERLHANTRRRS